MNAKKFSDAMSELDTKYVDEALNYKKKAKKPGWVKWSAMAACLCLIVVAIITIPSTLSPQDSDGGGGCIIADAPPMIYVNDTLYKQSASQTSFSELKEDFVYLGTIKNDVTNFQGTDDTGNNLDGIPKENFQANLPIVGAKVFQYGDDIVVGIEGKYWLYEAINDNTLDEQSELSEEEKMQFDPSYGAGIDGNPDGYDSLPNSQTSDEEVSEQDPEAN